MYRNPVLHPPLFKGPESRYCFIPFCIAKIAPNGLYFAKIFRGLRPFSPSPLALDGAPPQTLAGETKCINYIPMVCSLNKLKKNYPYNQLKTNKIFKFFQRLIWPGQVKMWSKSAKLWWQFFTVLSFSVLLKLHQMASILPKFSGGFAPSPLALDGAPPQTLAGEIN